MATSGSINYSETTRFIIRDALTMIGALEPGETPEAPIFSFCLRTLERMAKAWQAKGYNLWRTTEGEITLVANQQSYTMGGAGSPDFAIRPLRIESMRFSDSNDVETPEMVPLSREDYFTLPEKDAAGTPTQFYLDIQRASATLYIWPVPSSVSGDTLKFTYQRTIEDFDAATNEPDFPQEWFSALVKGLAAEIAPAMYPGNPQIQAFAKALADEAIRDAEDFDREWGEVVFTLGEPGYR